MLKICIFDKEQRLADKIENIIDKVCQERGIRKEVDVFSTEEDLNKEILIEGKYDITLFCIKEEKEVDVAIRMRKNDEEKMVNTRSDLGGFDRCGCDGWHHWM